MSKFAPTTIARFWSKADVGNKAHCWEWRGSARSGYGKIKIDGVTYSAHLVAFELSTGITPEGKSVCHTCDNPLCVNPRHLFLGTVMENARDKIEKGRAFCGDQSGANNGNAKLTAEQVQEIKRRISAGEANTAIAQDFPVGHAAISKIRTGVYWS